jgi:tripartite-type tricarboxylate transporter receptor subunit TctC
MHVPSPLPATRERRLQTAALATLTTFAALLAICQPVAAQEAWPSRPITLVVPFAAGSGTDIGARLLAKDLAESLGVSVVVDNRPGANGALGAQAVARAKADGYTLLVGSATTNAANFAFFPGKLGYEPGSFDIVAGLGSSAISLYVAANSPWRGVNDLVADARRNPNKFNCGSGNAVTQVACEVFRKQAGIEAVNVPYKSNPQSLTDVVGGQVSYAFADAAVAQVLLEGRKLKTLGVAAARRSSANPDAATFAEQGMPDFEIAAWTAVFAPAGTPASIVDKLHAAVRRSSQSAETVASRARSGSSALDLGVAEARRFAADQAERWARYVRDSGVKPE